MKEVGKRLIWEECGMTLEEYAKAFNKVLDEAFERVLSNKVYMFNFVDNEPRAVGMINVEDGQYNSSISI